MSKAYLSRMRKVEEMLQAARPQVQAVVKVPYLSDLEKAKEEHCRANAIRLEDVDSWILIHSFTGIIEPARLETPAPADKREEIRGLLEDLQAEGLSLKDVAGLVSERQRPEQRGVLEEPPTGGFELASIMRGRRGRR